MREQLWFKGEQLHIVRQERWRESMCCKGVCLWRACACTLACATRTDACASSTNTEALAQALAHTQSTTETNANARPVALLFLLQLHRKWRRAGMLERAWQSSGAGPRTTATCRAARQAQRGRHDDMDGRV